ncbi:MAG: DUF397 domain-containing protein [Pseudonocardiaceae bacterium]
MLTAPEPDGIVGHTASYSGSDSVEVASAPVRILVRDSKDADGPLLAVTTTAWRALLSAVTCGRRHSYIRWRASSIGSGSLRLRLDSEPGSASSSYPAADEFSDDPNTRHARSPGATHSARTTALDDSPKHPGPRTARSCSSEHLSPGPDPAREDRFQLVAPRCSQTAPSLLVRRPRFALLLLRIARFGGHRNPQYRHSWNI